MTDIDTELESDGQKRALSQIGGETHAWGDSKAAEFLTSVWKGASEAAPNDYTHGFHAYPARMHPYIARQIFQAWSSPGQVVVDPFVGSGTVMVEGLLAGLKCTGGDINPIALRIAWARTQVWGERSLRELQELTQDLGDEAFRRARRKAPVRLAPHIREEFEWYAPHVLMELQTLSDLIDTVNDPDFQEICRMVFSSLLVKVSFQTSESDGRRQKKQVGRGSVSRLFRDKSEEFIASLSEFAQAVPKNTEPPYLLSADARHLRAMDKGTVDLVMTSPPYPGTYRYHNHQDRRYPWLGGEPEEIQSYEIGRRVIASAQDRTHWERWEKDFSEVLQGIARVLRPGGRAVIVIGDSVLGGNIYRADRSTIQWAEEQGLTFVAGCAQERPHIGKIPIKAFQGQLRYEHILAFTKE